jgi:tetratricopeptide (TPR) repeat protein
MSTRTITVRQVSRTAAVIPPLVALAAIAVATAIAGLPSGIFWGLGLYVAHARGSRRLIARRHRRGVALLKQRRYREAIVYLQESLAFFNRHPWIDRLRSIVVMNPSAASYREMDLNNIAYCWAQLGDRKRARECYETCLARFPGNCVASTSIRALDAGRRPARQAKGDRSSKYLAGGDSSTFETMVKELEAQGAKVRIEPRLAPQSPSPPASP